AYTQYRRSATSCGDDRSRSLTPGREMTGLCPALCDWVLQEIDSGCPQGWDRPAEL
ncbi:hypothetical protein BaRGS_00028732, partial [Batillaria attramentaria]